MTISFKNVFLIIERFKNKPLSDVLSSWLVDLLLLFLKKNLFKSHFSLERGCWIQQLKMIVMGEELVLTLVY